MAKDYNVKVVYTLGEQIIQDMKNYLLEVWNWLNGKKSYVALALLFVYGGLSALGYDLVWLKDFALVLGGVGLLHGAYKNLK